MSIILDTPDQIAAARMLAIRSGLSLEIRTGMRLSRGRTASQIATDILKDAGMVAEGKRPNKATVYRLFNMFLVEQGLPDRPLD
jgi:hypothetical protein